MNPRISKNWTFLTFNPKVGQLFTSLFKNVLALSVRQLKPNLGNFFCSPVESQIKVHCYQNKPSWMSCCSFHCFTSGKKLTFGTKVCRNMLKSSSRALKWQPPQRNSDFACKGIFLIKKSEIPAKTSNPPFLSSVLRFYFLMFVVQSRKQHYTFVFERIKRHKNHFLSPYTWAKSIFALFMKMLHFFCHQNNGPTLLKEVLKKG